MHAIAQHRYGTDAERVLQLEEIATPDIGDGDVLVRVAAASVDMGTWHCMTGMPYAMRLAGFGVRSPKASNPGRALAGTVESVGKEVTEFRLGDEVHGTCDGSFAEYARVEMNMLASKPANLTFEQAAAVPISGGTALQAVRKANVQPGQTVLIVGASGGVGTFAVQIAKAFGAEVTGVCSTAKMDLVRSLGADRVIDYTRDDFTSGKDRYDVILDIGGSRRLWHLRRVLSPRGTLVIVGGETGGRWLGGFDRSLRAVLLSLFVGQKLGMLASKENAKDLNLLRDLIETGQVTPAIDRTYPLSETADAIRHVRDGRAQGKIVITVQGLGTLPTSDQ
ncbi:MAG TPA: NAD(P)-dependent alcohol dehydrogenase [Acidimicrobiales bacterium]|nr:NAD(P)-dependent alcohol dehydrogenase [Acidimicrobiales bacterium]